MSEEPEVTDQNEPTDLERQNTEASPSEGSAPEEIVEPAAPEEVAEVGREFLTGLLEAMGLEVQIESSIEGESVSLEVAGEELGVLIGRRGQTLDALQELARTAVQRRLRSRVRLMVDVEGYRARRRDSLADYARSIAERAKDRGTEIELEPMSSWDRKIVHDAVADVEGVTSFSEGVDPNRKVVIRAE
ncbi:MAG TPA: RNA-binding cell elongation regulator Jag/EloR [Actinomycetota bacterium]|nr:RNA-binding cell elongation regulator Jag/EloR [Actinomycetota bacterium]